MVVYVFQVADCKFSQNSLFHGSNCQKLGIFTDFFFTISFYLLTYAATGYSAATNSTNSERSRTCTLTRPQIVPLLFDE